MADRKERSITLIVAGLSGAGKSSCINAFSDFGFYTIDNLPVSLFPEFIELSENAPNKFGRSAILINTDDPSTLRKFLTDIKHFKSKKRLIEIVFLDASDEMIVTRFSETRRPHPGFNPTTDKSLYDPISRERELLIPLKEAAGLVIETSKSTVHDLRKHIENYVESLTDYTPKLRLNFFSFGYKHGTPRDCDLLIDVRFLPNPHFVGSLRSLTGLDREVAKFVLESASAKKFIQKYSDLLDYLLPLYVKEGKSYLNVGIGCTGGRHRSVAVVETMAKYYKDKQFVIGTHHRDLAS